MKNVFSGQEVINLAFKGELSYVTLVTWCRKGILNPYHRTATVGNRHDKSLFTLADIVLVGVIKNIFECRISHNELLEMELMLIGPNRTSWDGHKKELVEEGHYRVLPTAWKDMGRNIQQFLGRNKYGVIFRMQLNRGQRGMMIYCIEDTETVDWEKEQLFSLGRGYSGANVLINANLIYGNVRALLDPRTVVLA